MPSVLFMVTRRKLQTSCIDEDSTHLYGEDMKRRMKLSVDAINSRPSPSLHQADFVFAVLFFFMMGVFSGFEGDIPWLVCSVCRAH